MAEIKEKYYWRFKTKEEHIADGTLGIDWNSDGDMDYLFGTFLPKDFDKLADKGLKFQIENKKDNGIYTEWVINPKTHLKRINTSKMAEKSLQEALDVNKKVEEAPEFDIDRLAKDIDGIFQSQLTDAKEKLETEAETVYKNCLDKVEDDTEARISEYKAEVETIFPNIKDRLFEEFTKGRTTLVLPDKSEITVEHMDHPSFESVAQSLHTQRKAMLVGPAGTGKTHMVGQMAERLKLPFYKYSCSRDSSVHDLLGYKQPKSETYLETAFLQAYENGGIFLVDEYDAMSGDMALFFNGVADSSKFISIPHRDTKPQAIKHKDFYLVMCGNTWGKGSTDYSGRDFQDMALMDRFRFCRHHIGYHTLLEKDLMGTNYDYALALRTALEESGSYLSTRNIEDISIQINSKIPLEDITKMVVQDLTDEEGKRVTKYVNKYMKTGVKRTAGSSDDTWDNAVVWYEGKEMLVKDIAAKYPPTDTKALAKLQKEQPKLYEEYKYALSGLGFSI